MGRSSPEKERESARKHREKYPERVRELNRKWREANPVYTRVHGLSDSDYQRLLDGQGGVCAVCRGEMPLCVDHDHASDAIRGLLCRTCNRALGLFGDSQEGVMAAADYLGESEARVFLGIS